MADKIVQLVDQNDDNIYPVAGAMKDGTVDTNTILDGAVTGAKIDFSTTGGQCSQTNLPETTIGTSYVTLVSSSVSVAGRYIVMGEYYGTAASDNTYFSSVLHNNTSNQNIAICNQGRDGNNRVRAMLFGVADLALGDSVSLRASCGSGSMKVDGDVAIAFIRIMGS